MILAQALGLELLQQLGSSRAVGLGVGASGSCGGDGRAAVEHAGAL